MKLQKLSRLALGTTVIAIAALLMACGSEATATPPGPVSIPATPETQAPRTSQFDAERQIGDIEGIAFLVSEGSEATFTVREKLAMLSLPSDAVVRTSAITGEVYLDGRPSLIEIDLLQLGSDQSRRDDYIRRRMFRNDPIARFTLNDVGQIPRNFLDGDVIDITITGQLEILSVTVPITFEGEARDDGDAIFILGRSSFVWSDFEMRPPNIAGIVQVEDEVAVEILLVVRPVLVDSQMGATGRYLSWVRFPGRSLVPFKWAEVGTGDHTERSNNYQLCGGESAEKSPGRGTNRLTYVQYYSRY